MGLFDQHRFEVDVEGHPHPVTFTLGDARRGHSVRCSTCGKSIEVDAGNLDAELTKIEKQLRDMGFR